MDIPSLLAAAHNHAETGRFGEAEALYRRILAARPEEPNALYGLGFIALMAEAYGEAVRLIGAAVKRAPRLGAWHLTLGDALRYADRLPEAVRAYERAAKLLPDYPVAHNNLGAAYQQTGHYKEALAAFTRAVKLAPADPQYLVNLSAVLQKLERNDEARSHLNRALAVEPGYAPALINLGNTFIAQGEFEQAIPPLRQAVAVLPELQEARDNLAVALARSGKRDEALRVLLESLAHAPTPLTYKELCECLVKEHRPSEGETYGRQGLARYPDHPALHVAVGEALAAQGRVEDSLIAYRKAASLAGSNEGLGGTIAFLLISRETTPFEQKAAAEAACKRFGHPPARQRPASGRDPDRRLRVGYISPDFRYHSVAYFMQKLLAGHHRDRVQVVCYSSSLVSDGMTERLRAHADEWVDIGLTNDRDAVQRIRNDRIDILIDLAGHTTGNRLAVLARRPAPIQMTYLGYPGTTGLSTVDYRITDAVADPEGADPWYTEKLIRLPRVFLAYAPPEDSPPVEAPPATAGKPVTFGSFNAIHKLSDTALDLWAAVLRNVPGSRLLLKAAAFGDPGVVARYTSLFSERGIAPERLLLLGFEQETRHHLATYHQVDIALDTFPYHGTTTSCEALYMGVPVVTLAGQVHASRVGASLLGSVGLSELVATDEQGFVATASRLAADPDRLVTLRAGMRQRLLDSPLMDGDGLAHAMEDSFRRVWHAYTKMSAR